MPEVDDAQLAALRPLRVAFGPIEVVEVIRLTQSLAMTQRMIRVEAQESLARGRGWQTRGG